MTQKDIWRSGTAAAAIVLLAVPASVAQTTGRIAGTVTDASGAPVPGATVTVGSPSLQGTQSDTTNAAGEYRFPALPPGPYGVKVTKPQFKTVVLTVVVGLDRATTLPVELDVAAAAETVTVTGEGPLVDTASTTTGINATSDLFNRIPVTRDIYRLARVAPGTDYDGVGTVVYGSTGAENAYIIEGLNVTGVGRGEEIKQLNFDFVQEIEVKTGGLPAEYGRSTGGIVNVLTKSGGNELRGSLFGFFAGGGLQADDTTAAMRPADITTISDIDEDWDFGGELGGFLLKDRLWFYGAYDRTSRTDLTTVIRALSSPGSPALGAKVPSTITRNLYAGKLTYRLAENHTLTASVFGDPSKKEGDIFQIAGPESTWKGTVDSGGADYVGRYDGTFGRFLFRTLYGHHGEEYTTGGPGRSVPLLLDQTVTPSAASGGLGGIVDSRLERDVVKADVAGFLGGHDFKLGADFERVDARVERSFGGGQAVFKLIEPSTGRIYYDHVFFVDDRAPGFDATDPATWTVADPLRGEPQTRNVSAYVQDSWRVAKGLTLNLGVRWEQQDVRGRDQRTAFKLSDNWAPRIGLVWDSAHDGRRKVYASFGRFYENIPLDINVRAFGGELICVCYNFDSSPANTRPDPMAPSRSATIGSSVDPVDPDLAGQYMDEYLAGGEYEVARDLALGIKVTHRRLARVIEDLLVPSLGQYSIANPGQGLGRELAFFDGVNTAPSPQARRSAWAVELNARKRFSDGWQFLASYVWNRLEGNYDGMFQRANGQLDPNLNSAFDLADFLVNAEGRLTVERQHQVKFDGSYEFKKGLPAGLNVGLSAFYYSGIPLTAYGYSFLYGSYEYYLVPRGSFGRAPAAWEAHVGLGYPVRLGPRARLNLMVDVFNVFNRQAMFVPDQRYNLPANGACAGIPEDLCNGDGGLVTHPGTLTPRGVISNPRATAANPDFLKAGGWFTAQRSLRIGARLTF